MVEAGAFRTSAMQNAPQFSVPEVYTTPTSGVNKAYVLFGHLANPESKIGDPLKFAEKVLQLLALPDPPLRLPLGPDAVEFIEGHLKSVSKDLEGYRSWSADIVEQ